ncbi:hypothetical protein ACHAXT_011628 [Thalassiosira profunda]
MKYSPSSSTTAAGWGPPPRSPRSSLRAIGIMHAVTLACTAVSTVLLCLVFFSGQPTKHENPLGPAPERDGIREPKTARRYDRRSISTIGKGKANATYTTGPTGVILLMSYPNSGTSYTIHAIREMTNTTTATNYGLEGDIKDEPSIPAFKNSPNGPFVERIPGRPINLPNLVLTKTHCGGFSTSRNPLSYLETPRSFLKSCLKAKRGVYSDSGSLATRIGWYSQSLVKKVIHILRNPLDNTVARFHLERKRFTAKNDTAWLREYPNTKSGFRKWCKRLDKSTDLLRTRWVDKELADALAAVPCHAEFFRFVQWHNLAFIASEELALPTPPMVFHYEEYSFRFDDVTKELTTFLELEQTGPAEPFIANKRYADYYSDRETQAIADLVKEMSSKQTWQLLARYFDGRDEVVVAEA